jgi:hypothetical protein
MGGDNPSSRVDVCSTRYSRYRIKDGLSHISSTLVVEGCHRDTSLPDFLAVSSLFLMWDHLMHRNRANGWSFRVIVGEREGVELLVYQLPPGLLKAVYLIMRINWISLRLKQFERGWIVFLAQPGVFSRFRWF